MTENEALKEVIQRAGGVRALERHLDISHPTVMRWRRVPPVRVIELERLTGVSRHELRPDIYPREG